MSVLELDSVTKRYGAVTAVRDLDLSVDAGEVFGLLGPNGAGKSTTIDVVLDFVRPTSGTVRVVGRDPQAAPRAVRERVGVLPEGTGFYDRDTARDHVRFAIGMKRADDDPDRLLERVGIAHAADRPVGEFSKGMRRRLGLAVALVGAPDLLVLDEPLTGLDPSGARLLREVVREERDRGAAVFFSSHIMDQVEAVCDRVGIVDDGRLVAVDAVDALRANAAPTTLTLAVEAVPDGVVDDLRGLDGVADAAAGDGSITVECTDAAAKASAIRRVDAAGASIRDVDAEPPSLEQVFVALTEGRAADASADRREVPGRT
ncbi:MAG: ABC transporter ATP-binding protein [Haloferacaceae archaeon]